MRIIRDQLILMCRKVVRDFLRQNNPMILVGMGLVMPFWMPGPLEAQLVPLDWERLQQRNMEEGWTFEVGPSQATTLPVDRLCGLHPPGTAGILAGPLPNPFSIDLFQDSAVLDLPPAFNWCQIVPPPDVRNQGSCNSCWAHAAIGAVEFAILLREGVAVDLSEQWLISCSGAGTCLSGGWYGSALDLFLSAGTPDRCGQTGAVEEADFPYIQSQGTCDCPYPRRYFLDGWGISPNDINAIKWHIQNFGPVAAGVYAGPPFQAYQKGVFNACEMFPINHAVVIVGWDDTQGTQGVWIIRNSWGPDWGEGGYMRIEYGCSQIGTLSNYVDYRGSIAFPIKPVDTVVVETLADCSVPKSGSVYYLTNVFPEDLKWRILTSATWLTLSTNAGTLLPRQSQGILVSLNEQVDTMPVGTYQAELIFVDQTHRLVERRFVRLIVKPHSLLAHWKLDTITNGQVTDDSGQSHDARIVGPVMLTSGIFAQACRFDGIETKIVVGAEAVLQPADSITVSAWINPDNLSVVDMQPIVYNAFQLAYWEKGYRLFAADGQVHWWIKTATGQNGDAALIGAPVTPGQWSHVVGTYDGAAVTLYVNGLAVESTLRNGAIQWGAAPYSGFHIGGVLENAVDHGFAGKIDDVRLYDYALNLDEIQLLYRGLAGDIDEDWRVDMVDLNAWVSYWLDLNPPPHYDLNMDGFVDLLDLAVFAEGWGMER